MIDIKSLRRDAIGMRDLSGAVQEEKDAYEVDHEDLYDACSYLADFALQIGVAEQLELAADEIERLRTLAAKQAEILREVVNSGSQYKAGDYRVMQIADVTIDAAKEVLREGQPR